MTREEKKMQTRNQGRVAVWAITPNGIKLGGRLARAFAANHPLDSRANPPGPYTRRTQEDSQGVDLFVTTKLASLPGCPEGAMGFQTLTQTVQEQFHGYDSHIFIFSTGIAVRVIAPLLRSKCHDPAVVVVDDRGINAISLVSGHLGGANDLARTVAAMIHARPIITTATDVNQLPAIDLVAKAGNLAIENPEAIKTINMAFLQGEPVEVHDPYGLVMPHIPHGLAILTTGIPEKDRPSVVCTDTTENVPRETLVLRPQILALGIGCNRGTSLDEIQAFLDQMLRLKGLSRSSIFTIGTTEVKQDEQGILSLAHTLGRDIKFYDKPTLNSVTTIENPSKMVEKHLGVKSVCEAAAILASNNGNLIVPKMKQGNVTLAVARKQIDCLSSGPAPGM
ncbi:CbiG [Desulforapulum autotrophicum HRM2]|uniref:CbiG n=1 Tax=Desulforapulum autotrophicum (strain ATCC 43914 / DSM 3382 / VKM B-1955 / HRM2) TaxID=177437 RepID=C0QFF3_DESAH|nr:cobalt-precorrin 5A hydrolase [Desulforapulum autotrophicum]ACN13349.1 CbiG [Desulforapulum autotrophicum HRM2]